MPLKPHQSPKKSPPKRFSISIGIVLLLLALLPSLATWRLAQLFDPRLIYGFVGVVNVLTFWLYWHDKRRAQQAGWRTPESTLHLAELFGGWPAAFLAQRAFRHKISKRSYQVTYWLIVLLYEAASFDFLGDWRYTSAAFRALLLLAK